MKITIEVDQSKWTELASEVTYDIGNAHIPVATVYHHDKSILLIVYDWNHGIYTVLRPCGKAVCCVQDMMIAQAIVELIETNKP